MPFAPRIPGRDLTQEKVILFSDGAEILWLSPAWAPDPKDYQAIRDSMLSRRWQEFIYPPDLPQLVAFFADGQDGKITFRAMTPYSGGAGIITYVKIRYLTHWLVVAGVEKIPPLPAPPCVYLDDLTDRIREDGGSDSGLAGRD